MPTVAETSQAKRHLSDLLLAEDGGGSNTKRQRVRFDDTVEVLSSDKTSDDGSAMSIQELHADQEEEEEDVDFVLSIGEDGDWDYSITTAAAAKQGEAADDGAPPAEEQKAGEKRSRPASPFAGSDRRLSEELYAASDEGEGDEDAREELFPTSFNLNGIGGLGLKISMSAIESASAAAGAMPTPLITPPSSPRRIRTMSVDGATTEEATMCEWPCNLTVDNAITAALESAPLTLPPGSSCAEGCGE